MKGTPSSPPDKRWVTRHPAALDAFIVAIGALATAGVGVAFADLTPPTAGETVPAGWWWFRLGLTVTLLVALVALVYVRQRDRQDFGTLYYVSGLQRPMSDRHTEALVREASKYADFKMLSADAIPTDGEDVSAKVRELARELNIAMNSDSPATGFHLAPNALWPVAVALGYQANLRDNHTLVELQGENLSWHLKATPKQPVTSPEVRPMPSSASGVAGTPVALLVHLTKEGPVTLATNWTIGERYDLAVWEGDDPHTVTFSTKPLRDPFAIHPAFAVAEIVTAIGQVIHEHPDAAILLFSRIPKTVAVGLGYHLYHRERPICGVIGCIKAGCADPWSRLVPMLMDQSPGATPGSYVAAYVMEGQPSQVELDRWQRS